MYSVTLMIESKSRKRQGRRSRSSGGNMDDIKEEEEDERREAAMASTPSLQSDFKSHAVAPTQLSKFQELHRRRLEIKSKSKFKKKQKDGASKSHCKNPSTKDCEDEDSSGLGSNNHDNKKEGVATHLFPTQRQKLYWGLDTKERWERKANM